MDTLTAIYVTLELAGGQMVFAYLDPADGARCKNEVLYINGEQVEESYACKELHTRDDLRYLVTTQRHK